MKIFTSIFRGRRFEQDERTSSITVRIDVQGSALSAQELRQLVADAVRRYGEGSAGTRA